MSTRVHRNVPRRFTFSTRSQSATGMSASSDWVKMPALLTRMSTRVNRPSTLSAMARTAASSLTSHRTNSASLPQAVMSASTPAAFSRGAASTTATSAPSRANATAMPYPMPDAAPVTTATLSCSLPMPPSPLRSPYILDRGRRCHVEAVPHEDHGGVVLLLVVAAHAILSEDHIVVAEHRVTGGGLYAAFCRAAAHDHRFDAVAAEQQLQVRAPECAGTILRHDQLIRQRRQIPHECVPGRARDRVPQRRAIASHRLVHPEVEPDLRGRVAHPAGQRRVLDVHHQHAVPACRREQARQPRPYLGVHRHVDPH